jgi:hypothetical protein
MNAVSDGNFTRQSEVSPFSVKVPLGAKNR